MSAITNAINDIIGHVRAETAGRAATLEREAANIRLQGAKRIEQLEAVLKASELQEFEIAGLKGANAGITLRKGLEDEELDAEVLKAMQRLIKKGGRKK